MVFAILFAQQISLVQNKRVSQVRVTVTLTSTGFELRPGHEIPWMRFSVVFLRPVRQVPG